MTVASLYVVSALNVAKRRAVTAKYRDITAKCRDIAAKCRSRN
jgi:hypothetical protein